MFLGDRKYLLIYCFFLFIYSLFLHLIFLKTQWMNYLCKSCVLVLSSDCDAIIFLIFTFQKKQFLSQLPNILLFWYLLFFFFLIIIDILTLILFYFSFKPTFRYDHCSIKYKIIHWKYFSEFLILIDCLHFSCHCLQRIVIYFSDFSLRQKQPVNLLLLSFLI